MGFGLETKVGIFIIISIALLAVLGITFGKVSFTGDKTYTVVFDITDANGLKSGTKVYYRGVKVGALKDVVLIGEKLSATVDISDKYQIPNNVDFAIRQAGFVGERNIDLIPNKLKSPSGFLVDGHMYDGRQVGSSLESVMDSINVMAEQIGILAESINTIVSKDDTQDLLQETLTSIKGIAASIDSVLVSNNENLNDIIGNVQKATTVLNRIIEKNEDQIGSTITNIDELAVTLKDLSSTLNQFIKNNEGQLTAGINNIANISDQLDTAVTNIKTMTDDISQSKGTLGMLINDNQTKEDVQSAIKGVKNLVSGFDNFKYYLAFGGDYLINLNKARGYAQLKLFATQNSYINIGVSNTPHRSPRITNVNFTYTDANGVKQTGTYTKDETLGSALAVSLQYGYIFDKLFGVRVGLFDSAIGAGVDIYPLKSHTLIISAEVYDFVNNPRRKNRLEVFSRLYARYHFLDNFFVQAGLDDVMAFNKLTFTVGAGFVFMDESLKYKSLKNKPIIKDKKE